MGPPGVKWLGRVRKGRKATSIGKEEAKEDRNGDECIVLL